MRLGVLGALLLTKKVVQEFRNLGVAEVGIFSTPEIKKFELLLVFD